MLRRQGDHSHLPRAQLVLPVPFLGGIHLRFFKSLKKYLFNNNFRNKEDEDFPGGTVARTPSSQCRGPKFHL